MKLVKFNQNLLQQVTFKHHMINLNKLWQDLIKVFVIPEDHGLEYSKKCLLQYKKRATTSLLSVKEINGFGHLSKKLVSPSLP